MAKRAVKKKVTRKKRTVRIPKKRLPKTKSTPPPIDEDAEVARLRAIEKIRAEMDILTFKERAKVDVWKMRERARVEYDSAQTRMETREGVLTYVPIPPTRWRPGHDTTEVAIVMLDLIANGYSVTEIRRAHPAYPSGTTLRKWGEDDAEFYASYARAMEEHVIARADMAVVISAGDHRTIDDNVTVNRDRIHADSMLKAAQFVASRQPENAGPNASTWADLVASAEAEEARIAAEEAAEAAAEQEESAS